LVEGLAILQILPHLVLLGQLALQPLETSVQLLILIFQSLSLLGDARVLFFQTRKLALSFLVFFL
jgi:hypothetical protein